MHTITTSQMNGFKRGIGSEIVDIEKTYNIRTGLVCELNATSDMDRILEIFDITIEFKSDIKRLEELSKDIIKYITNRCSKVKSTKLKKPAERQLQSLIDTLNLSAIIGMYITSKFDYSKVQEVLQDIEITALRNVNTILQHDGNKVECAARNDNDETTVVFLGADDLLELLDTGKVSGIL